MSGSFVMQRISRFLSAFTALGLFSAVVGCSRAPEPAPQPAPVAASPARREFPEIVRSPQPPEPPQWPSLDGAAPPLTVNKSARVSVLGYHEFTKGKPSNPMQVSEAQFRAQMQAIREAQIPVISMPDFLAWRRGEKDLPNLSVLITMDDGWESVHRIALPVLREFGYPFTVFLYKRFVNGGSKSMTTAEIRELMAAGATIGSHSVSHPYRKRIDAAFRKGPKSGEAFLRTEMRDSRQFLEDLLGQTVTTYAYPGGFHSSREEEFGREAGYEALFTVNPARVTWDTPAAALGRFIVMGTDPSDAAFKLAIRTRGTVAGLRLGQSGEGDGEVTPGITVSPEPDSVVASRRPVLSVEFPETMAVDPGSLVMTVAGVGRVPAEFDAAGRTLSWQIREPLRSNECRVSVSFRGATAPQTTSLRWRFFVDLVSAYLPEAPEQLATPEEITIPETGAPEETGESPDDGTAPR
jgi:peptidoglycan/xylan/chitin deacetylase (PgdA/CDA1 family)